MGAKRCGKGQHVFLYLAGCLLMLIVFPGCAHFFDGKMPFITKSRAGALCLDQVRDFIQKKEYDAALTEINKFPDSIEDHAWFQRGIVYASSANSQKDFGKSVGCFQFVIDNFPESSLHNEAAILVNLLRYHIAREKEKAELIALSDQFLQLDGNAGKKRVSLKKLFQKQNQQITALQRQIESLKEQLKQLKEIDLGIEEKKRQTLPK